MPSIIARQDALVFVDRSKVDSLSSGLIGSGDALFWSPGVLVGKDEQDAFFSAMKAESRSGMELDGHTALVCFFEDASWYAHY